MSKHPHYPANRSSVLLRGQVRGMLPQGGCIGEKLWGMLRYRLLFKCVVIELCIGNVATTGQKPAFRLSRCGPVWSLLDTGGVLSWLEFMVQKRQQ